MTLSMTLSDLRTSKVISAAGNLPWAMSENTYEVNYNEWSTILQNYYIYDVRVRPVPKVILQSRKPWQTISGLSSKQ